MRQDNPITATDFVFRAVAFSFIGYLLGSWRGVGFALLVLLVLYAVTIFRRI